MCSSDLEVWVHHYDLENQRVAPETPPIINFGRPSQDMTGAPSTAPSSSTQSAPVTGNPACAEPTLKTPAAPTPSRITAGDPEPQKEKQAQPTKGPKASGYTMKKFAAKSPPKPTRASASLNKDKSPVKKDSSTAAEKSTPTKDQSLDDF